MADWRLAMSLMKLREQVDHLFPNRSKASDGTIGNAAHAANKSDHNPNAAGIVCAWDVTHSPVTGCNAGHLVEALRKSRDPRIKYVIFNRRMFSSYPSGGVAPWTWRKYTGENPHDKHAHVSVGTNVDDAREWVLA